MLIAFLKSRLDPDEWEDTAQQVRLGLMKSVCGPRFDGANIIGLMFAIAGRRVQDARRWHARHPEAKVSDETWTELPETNSVPSADEDLQHCLQRLPAALLLLVQRFYWDGVEQKDLATETAQPPGTVSWHMAEARRKLKQCLESRRHE